MVRWPLTYLDQAGYVGGGASVTLFGQKLLDSLPIILCKPRVCDQFNNLHKESVPVLNAYTPHSNFEDFLCSQFVLACCRYWRGTKIPGLPIMPLVFQKSPALHCAQPPGAMPPWTCCACDGHEIGDMLAAMRPASRNTASHCTTATRP